MIETILHRKFQIPSTKFQAPDNKYQITNNKTQTHTGRGHGLEAPCYVSPNSKIFTIRKKRFGIWILTLLVGHFQNVRRVISVWNLEFGAWNLLFVIWCLMLASACRTPTERMEGYEIHGIDVSHYQEEINWEIVMSQDIDFVYIKASEGQEMKDKRFAENWKALGKQKVKRGAYHFFRPTINVLKQTENYINFVKLSTGDLPPALDVEVLDGASPEKLREGVQIWLSTVEKAYGVRPVIYTNQDFYHDHLHGYFDEYPLWIARYNKRKPPDLRGKQQWTFWQYGNRGRLDGINGNVDFNVFHGDSVALVRFCNDEMLK